MGKGHIIIDFIQSFSKLFQKTGKDKWKMCENWCKLKKEREREGERENFVMRRDRNHKMEEIEKDKRE